MSLNRCWSPSLSIAMACGSCSHCHPFRSGLSLKLSWDAASAAWAKARLAVGAVASGVSDPGAVGWSAQSWGLSLIHISEPTRLALI
eukprot:3724354-Alexandrium_andersonii.AAC.3